ncbi:MAG: hypothetical protein AAF791_14325 [Bacteroidota bacterium]
MPVLSGAEGKLAACHLDASFGSGAAFEQTPRQARNDTAGYPFCHRGGGTFQLTGHERLGTLASVQGAHMSEQETRDKAFLIGAGGASGLALFGAVALDCVTTGGAITAATVGTTLFGKVMEATTGAGIGPLVDAARERLRGTGSVADLHRNHHLENVLRQAVHDALMLTADERPEDREALKAIATEANALRFLQPGPDGEPVPAEALWLVDAFAVLPADGLTSPLSADEWRGVMIHLEGRARYRKAPRERTQRTISHETREAVVARLGGTFPVLLGEIITGGEGDNPQALAKLMLRMQGETLALVRAMAEAQPTDTADLASETRRQTQHLRDWIDENVPAMLRAELAPLFEDVARLSQEIRDLKAVVRETAAKTQADVQAVGKEVKALREDLVAQAAPFVQARQADTLSTDAPALVDVFTGRTADWTRVVNMLETKRCVNLHGLGGIGKTELTRKVAREVEARAPGWAASGVWYVDLSGATTADAVLSTIATAWGITDGADSGQALGSRLNAPRLYLLDDVEQAWASPSQSASVRTLVQEFCAYARDARVLVTSRSDLGARGVTPDRLGALPETDACALFEAIADAQGYVRVDGDEATRDALLLQLDGIPLAITLVASLLGPPGASDYGLAEIARRWETLIEREAGEDADKDRSLRVSLTLSHDALSDPDARSLFALFADLPGGADASLLRATFVSDDDPEGDAGVDAARVLRRRGLIRQTEDGRYAMRVPVREFAATQSAADLLVLRKQLDAYLLAFADHNNRRWDIDPLGVNNNFYTEYLNLKAAILRNMTSSDDSIKSNMASYSWLLSDAMIFFDVFGISPLGYTREVERRNKYLKVNRFDLASGVAQILGNSLWGIKAYKESEKWYRIARGDMANAGNSIGETECSVLLASALRMMERYKDAIDYINYAIEMFNSKKYSYGMINIYTEKGEIELALGMVNKS